MLPTIKLTKNGERVIFWGFIACAVVVLVAYFGYHNDRTVFAFGLVASWLFVVKALSIPPDKGIRIWWL